MEGSKVQLKQFKKKKIEIEKARKMLAKEIAKNLSHEQKVNAIKASNQTYWQNLTTLLTKELDSIMILFNLDHTKTVIVGGKEKKKKKLLNEKKSKVEGLGTIDKELFNKYYDAIKTRQLKLELSLKETEYALVLAKIDLFESIDQLDIDDFDAIDCQLRNVIPLEGEQICSYNNPTIVLKLNELLDDKTRLKEGIKCLQSNIKDRPILPEADDIKDVPFNNYKSDYEGDTDEPFKTNTSTNSKAYNAEYKPYLGQQFDIFIHIGFDEINSHFKQWLTELFFFGIALSIPPIATIIAKKLLDNDLENQHESDNDFYSPVHKRSFNLGQFFEFINIHTNKNVLTDIRHSSYF